jgi:hypothetical protein
MNSQINELIRSFEPDSKKSKNTFDQFLLHVYLTFDKRIHNMRSDKLKNKYKEIKKSVLNHIILHKTDIVKELK